MVGFKWCDKKKCNKGILGWERESRIWMGFKMSVIEGEYNKMESDSGEYNKGEIGNGESDLGWGS